MIRRHPSFFRLGAAAVCVASSIAGATAACASAVAEGGKAGAHAAHGKPTSGVTVTPTVPAKIALGETVTVRLRFSGVTAADGATVEVRDPTTRATLLSTRLARGEQKTIDLPYTGRTDGMQFIDVATTQAGRSSVQSVPLPVGSGQLKLKSEGQRQTTTGGEAVISLPASSPGAGR
ncbi:MAG: hypothetical protein HZC37_03650 [Burkholderiales bacterium]|nr:hypothetical protein [Burkholderiales bacterium]